MQKGKFVPVLNF